MALNCFDCNITLNGITRDCEGSRGGILKVWLAPCASITSITEADGVISAITSAPEWKEYSVNPFSSFFESTVSIDQSTGYRNVLTALTLVFSKMTVEKNNELNQLMTGGFVAAVKDANGEYWFLGADESLYLTDSTAATGTAREDLNGYTINIEVNESHLPYGMAAAIAPDAPTP